MNTSADAPYLDAAYKLTEYEGTARRKRSEGKATWPGGKQVFRRLGSDGRLAGDVLALEGDADPGEPLLHQVMAGGVRTAPPTALAASRELAARQLASLPPALRELEPARLSPVAVAPSVVALAAAVDERMLALAATQPKHSD